ncbi:copper chaperone Copz family protein [Methanococcoides sp. SA1]|nr:copper chaperone Copz family protein [Methanococcoides sp. SA1]
MSSEKLNQTCCCSESTSESSNCCDETIIIGFKEKTEPCPVCENNGMLVGSITVKHMVLNELAEQVLDDNYHLCMNEKCDIAYYNLESNSTFETKDIKVPIWFKKDADPKYACYCNKITEDQVIKIVVEKGLTTMKDIVLDINGNMKSQCKINNPTGKCCSKVFNSIINKGLAIKNNNIHTL